MHNICHPINTWHAVGVIISDVALSTAVVSITINYTRACDICTICGVFLMIAAIVTAM